jgi:hypothetical protein
LGVKSATYYFDVLALTMIHPQIFVPLVVKSLSIDDIHDIPRLWRTGGFRVVVSGFKLVKSGKFKM